MRASPGDLLTTAALEGPAGEVGEAMIAMKPPLKQTVVMGDDTDLASLSPSKSVSPISPSLAQRL